MIAGEVRMRGRRHVRREIAGRVRDSVKRQSVTATQGRRPPGCLLGSLFDKHVLWFRDCNEDLNVFQGCGV